MNLYKGQRVRSGAQGPTFNLIGVIRDAAGPVRIHWEGNVMSCSYAIDSAVVQQLQSEMNSPEKMAEVRARYGLPELGAPHECHAEPDGPSERSRRLSKPSPCYAGQWTIHGPHDQEVRVQNWLGGGTAITHCPGKTAETVLR